MLKQRKQYFLRKIKKLSWIKVTLIQLKILLQKKTLKINSNLFGLENQKKNNHMKNFRNKKHRKKFINKTKIVRIFYFNY